MCYNQFINKRKFRAHSVRHVIAEIEWLKKHHQISAVIFLDDNFFSDPKRALEIVRNLGLPWTASFRANYAALWGQDFRSFATAAAWNSESSGIGVPEDSESHAEGHYGRGHPTKRRIVPEVRHPRPVRLHDRPARRDLADMLKTFQLMDDLGKMGDGVFAGGPLVYLPWPGTALFDLAVGKAFIVPNGWRSGPTGSPAARHTLRGPEASWSTISGSWPTGRVSRNFLSPGRRSF